MKLTNARRHGLAVLLSGDRSGTPVYESNVTCDSVDAARTNGRLTVYWQTVRWLVEHGYATVDRRAANRVALTATGLDFARQATR